MVTVARYIGLWAENREALLKMKPSYFPWPGVELPCGNWVRAGLYVNPPEGDLVCPCGDETHWLVKYGAFESGDGYCPTVTEAPPDASYRQALVVLGPHVERFVNAIYDKSEEEERFAKAPKELRKRAEDATVDAAKKVIADAIMAKQYLPKFPVGFQNNLPKDWRNRII